MKNIYVELDLNEINVLYTALNRLTYETIEFFGRERVNELKEMLVEYAYHLSEDELEEE